MRRVQNKKSAFTLIEIIVVLVILGILAVFAAINLFQNIGASKEHELDHFVEDLDRQVRGCAAVHPANPANFCVGPPYVDTVVANNASKYFKNFTVTFSPDGNQFVIQADPK